MNSSVDLILPWTSKHKVNSSRILGIKRQQKRRGMLGRQVILTFIHFLLEKELELYKTNPIKERERKRRREGGTEGGKEREKSKLWLSKKLLFIQSMYLRQFFSNERMTYYLLSRFVSGKHWNCGFSTLCGHHRWMIFCVLFSMALGFHLAQMSLKRVDG